MTAFFSNFVKLGALSFPEFSDTRVLMMPIVLGDVKSLPPSLAHYRHAVSDLFDLQPYEGEIAYLTIDEKLVEGGKTHRRRGLHMDGYEPETSDDRLQASGSWGGGSGSWGGGRSSGNQKSDRSDPSWEFDKDGIFRIKRPTKPSLDTGAFSSPNGTGMMLVSSLAGCDAWKQLFSGTPDPQGDCEHMRDQCLDQCRETLEPGMVYWLDPYCIHESLEQPQPVKRQLMRLSLPSECGWFEGCTPNPLGVMPTGPILPRRNNFMDNPNLY